MSREPRDPALRRMLSATVRVNDGSGVVVRSGSNVVIATANHVVKPSELARVWHDTDFSEVTVLAKSVSDDLAVLGCPAILEPGALDLAEGDSEAVVGDSIWAGGFPRGWSGTQPVLARGTVAGMGQENWVNLDGTWGNSGGPLCRALEDGSSPLIGVLLGNASEPHEALRMLNESYAEAQADMQPKLKPARRVIAKPSLFSRIWVGPIDVISDIFDMHRQSLVLGYREGRIVLRLLEEHFRTGFLRFAAARDLRKLLA
jgi:hypothetical protein